MTLSLISSVILSLFYKNLNILQPCKKQSSYCLSFIMNFVCKGPIFYHQSVLRNCGKYVLQMQSKILPSYFARCFTNDSDDIPNTMRRWEITEYGSLDNLTLNRSALVPGELKPDQILLKTFATSVNPIDTEMLEGYGRVAINTLRKVYGVNEFPLVLGRDGSGVAVKTGKNVRRFKVGDEVWCARWIIGDGTHSEFASINQSEASLKPKSLSHIESASLPYVACTVWAALIGRAGLDPEKSNNKNVLILGGSGGVGTFAIQLAKLLGNNVTATCSLDNFDMVKKYGASVAIDYNSVTYEEDVKANGPYDVILDASKEGQSKKIGGNSKSIYITLMPPFLPSIDKHGLAMGLAHSGRELFETNFRNLLNSQGRYTWGFFYPNGGILKKVAELVDDGKISPVIDSVRDFEDMKSAFDHVRNGQTRGKVILKIRS